MKQTIIIILLILSGCDIASQRRQNVQNYTCSDDQLVQVEKELDVCKTSGMTGGYCFNQAKISICTYNNRINRDD